MEWQVRNIVSSFLYISLFRLNMILAGSYFSMGLALFFTISSAFLWILEVSCFTMLSSLWLVHPVVNEFSFFFCSLQYEQTMPVSVSSNHGRFYFHSFKKNSRAFGLFVISKILCSLFILPFKRLRVPKKELLNQLGKTFRISWTNM